MAERTTNGSGVNGTGSNGTTLREVIAPDGPDLRLRQLSEEVSRLVRSLPGPLTGVTARIGDSQVEITWANTTGPAQVVVAATSTPAEPVAPQAESGKTVDAPLVGTFYHAEQPGARSFVEVGDQIAKGQTIGIVEAMKLMNRVPSEYAGTVTEILVSDGTAVEFGQPLVRIEPTES